MFQRRFNMLPSSIHIVGVGGTGSRVVGPVAQMIASHPILKDITKIFLYDGDEVETKNLARQNFGPRDVGQNKAQVLAKRYSRAYNVPVIGVNQMVTSQGNGGAAFTRAIIDAGLDAQEFDSAGARVVILGVDSLSARYDIIADHLAEEDQHFNRHCQRDGCNAGNFRPGSIIIDAGNENTFGQVRVFEPIIYCDRMASNHRQTLNETKFEGSVPLHVPIPIPLDDYVAGAKNKPEADVSCADLDQTLAINFQMACGITTVMQNILLNHAVSHHTWYYDLHNGNSQAPMSHQWLVEAFERPMLEGGNARRRSMLKGFDPSIHTHVKEESFERLVDNAASRINHRLVHILLRSWSDMLEDGSARKVDKDMEAALKAAFAGVSAPSEEENSDEE